MKYIDIAKEKFEKLKNKKDVLVLGIESSCDETSISVVKNGREILSNVIATQIAIHKRFGGVVPEVASRNHILAISNVLNSALQEAKISLKDIDAVAVTYGAGLVGALLVGVSFAKALAFSLNIPLVAVSHIDGHIAANYLSHPALTPPFVCLMVSGGHTALLDVSDYTTRTLLGTTIDDAAGEAFDKVARVLGLPYPGGVEIDNLAKQGNENITFLKHEILPNSLNFSFSGVKTAVINYLNTQKQKNINIVKEDVAASFQKLVVNQLSSKAMAACTKADAKKLVVAGGVGANSGLKASLSTLCKENDVQLFQPSLALCTDNAAMIASAGYYYIKSGKGLADLSLTAKPVVKL